MYTINDIEIFITTHNRANFLRTSIESILNQTANVKEITILDNESSDNTEEVVKSYADRGVRYIKTYGFLGNYNKAKEISSKKYCMLFHDDDILHPKYLELALEVLNKYDDISLITTRYTEFFDNKIPVIKSRLSRDCYVFNTQKDFAVHLYFIEHIAYATAIYRTSDFKQTPLEYEKYNKFNDWPLMVKIAKYGKTILFADKALFMVRRHSGQDTWTSTNSPSLEQIVNWDKCFYDAMDLQNSKSKIYHKIFNRKCWLFEKGKYENFLQKSEKKEHPIEDLIKLAEENGLEPYHHDRYKFAERKFYKFFIKFCIKNKYLIH